MAKYAKTIAAATALIAVRTPCTQVVRGVSLIPPAAMLNPRSALLSEMVKPSLAAEEEHKENEVCAPSSEPLRCDYMLGKMRKRRMRHVSIVRGNEGTGLRVKYLSKKPVSSSLLRGRVGDEWRVMLEDVKYVRVSDDPQTGGALLTFAENEFKVGTQAGNFANVLLHSPRTVEKWITKLKAALGDVAKRSKSASEFVFRDYRASKTTQQAPPIPPKGSAYLGASTTSKQAPPIPPKGSAYLGASATKKQAPPVPSKDTAGYRASRAAKAKERLERERLQKEQAVNNSANFGEVLEKYKKENASFGEVLESTGAKDKESVSKSGWLRNAFGHAGWLRRFL